MAEMYVEEKCHVFEGSALSRYHRPLIVKYAKGDTHIVFTGNHLLFSERDKLAAWLQSIAEEE